MRLAFDYVSAIFKNEIEHGYFFPMFTAFSPSEILEAPCFLLSSYGAFLTHCGLTDLSDG